MSAALDKAGKAAASTLPTVVPVLVYAGVGYLIYRAVRDAIKNLPGDKEPGVDSQSVLGLTPESITGRITGRIVSPKNGDQVTSAGVASYTYSMTLEVTNPFTSNQSVLLEINTKEFPNLMPETGASWSGRVDLKPGRNVVKATVRRASVVNIGVTIPAYAELVIDGRPATQAVYYEIE